MVKIFFINRITAVFLRKHKAYGIRKAHRCLYRSHIISVSHNILCFFVSKLKDIGNHLRFTLQKHSLLMTFLHKID